jgi:hypothetical protein
MSTKTRKISYRQYLSLILNQVQRQRPGIVIANQFSVRAEYQAFKICSSKSCTPSTKAKFLGVDLGGGTVANSKVIKKTGSEKPQAWLQIQHNFALNCGDNLKAA